MDEHGCLFIIDEIVGRISVGFGDKKKTTIWSVHTRSNIDLVFDLSTAVAIDVISFRILSAIMANLCIDKS